MIASLRNTIHKTLFTLKYELSILEVHHKTNILVHFAKPKRFSYLSYNRVDVPMQKETREVSRGLMILV